MAQGRSPDGDARPFKLGYLIHDVSRLRRTAMDQAMRPLGLTRSQWSVLSALSRSGDDGMMQVDLARLLEVGKVTVGGLVDRLEATGMVRREPDPADRRAKRVCVTERGHSVIHEMIAVAAGMNDRILAGFSAEDRRRMEELLGLTKANLRTILSQGTTPVERERPPATVVRLPAARLAKPVVRARPAVPRASR